MAQESGSEGSKGSKIFNDPVHGSIEMPELCVRIIDTPEFQRLRNIKQLGGCYFVYPGASHNRFEHSIGTAHLAGCLVEGLNTRQPELKISDEDVLCVKIAGLCHDLGHGPFSHLFDRSFIPKALKGTEKETWKHEQASLDMFDTIFESIMENNSEEHKLVKTDAKFIKELIDGPKKPKETEADEEYEERVKNKDFLFEIISNKESGVDVDKWDYFARDCHHLGMKNSFDHVRCIKMARVIEVDGKKHICFRDKQALDIYEMFHLRANLHRRAYQHKTSNAIELMITDALLKADRKLEMSKAIDNMAAYTKLTDQVYYQILHSSDKELKEAKKILERIERRDLYRLIGEEKADEDIKLDGAEKEIIKKAKEVSMNLNDIEEEDIVIDKTKFDYGRKKEDPVKNVYFYEKTDQNKTITFGNNNQFSYMLPKNFVEWKIRLYLRKELKKEEIETKRPHLQKGFEAWFKEKNGADADGGAAAGGASASDGADAAGANREDATPEKSPDAGSRDGGTAKKKLFGI